MEHSSLVFGVMVGIIAGVIAQEATISVNQAIVVKPTPNPLTNPGDRVDITLQCICSRTDLSYYIKNKVIWNFTSNVDGKNHPVTTSFYKYSGSESAYAPKHFGKGHFDFEYMPDPASGEMTFILKINGVTYSDDGVYTCSLLQGGTTVIDQKTVQVTVVHPVDSVNLSLKQGDNELFSAMQPAGVNEAANKLKPGNYTAMCQAEGSNPEPEIHLMMNGEKYSNAPITMKSVIDNQRPSYMKKIDKTYDLTHREMEQVLSCEANIPGGMYQPQVASMKLKVQIVKPTIDCENITRSIGDNYVSIECTITSQSDVMCEMVSWQFADRNEVITLGEAVKDPEQKYDIVKAECTAVDEKTAKTTLTIYKANAAHFKAVYYVNYGVGEHMHRHPVSINLDTTISGSNLVVPLSMLVYIVMAAVSKLL
ncbi:uncharacterized protein LOC128203454 isoform X1 [Mya arenaria]|uniref:uncharacterized protein LOC128203454 isoform X1 n=1 Tax=Mya arenaria TaxID=6604 RepID=UPI0022E4A857|nr:uncharacterized protein LOC128203454 isoform X1 [Mya arenaria]